MSKTVITYFNDGDLKGPLYAYISNKICRMYVVPRSKLFYLKMQPELQKPAFYVLIGEDRSIYIGQTDNFCERVKDHNSKKPNWQKALIFVSTSGGLTSTDVRYLEYKAIAEAKKELSDNKQKPKAPNISQSQKAPMDDFFEDVKFLVLFLGYNIFYEAQHETEYIFYTKARGCKAQGFYNSSNRSFTVMKGSVIAKTSTAHYARKRKREDLLKQYTTANAGELVMKSDKTFKSPSAAAEFCIGCNSNVGLNGKTKIGSL